MANTKTVLSKTGELTPKSDKKGIEIFVCDPGWFDKKDNLKIANATSRTADLEFSGSDLNFVARVLYAESAGSAQLKDLAERAQEKEAILNVKYFRLNRIGYPNRVKAKTFTDVCKAPNQFESVYASSPKFAGSDVNSYLRLIDKECADLAEAIAAVRTFMKKGPNKDFVFDNFRGGKGNRGKTIGLTRFFLSDEGRKMHEKEA